MELIFPQASGGPALGNKMGLSVLTCAQTGLFLLSRIWASHIKPVFYFQHQSTASGFPEIVGIYLCLLHKRLPPKY